MPARLPSGEAGRVQRATVACWSRTRTTWRAAMVDDGDRLAESLTATLARLSFTDLDADQVTGLLIDAVVGWGEAAGWRVYRRARSVMTLPPPYADRHSWVDVACARAGARPVV